MPHRHLQIKVLILSDKIYMVIHNPQKFAEKKALKAVSLIFLM